MLKNIFVLLYLLLSTICHAQYELVIDSLYSEVEKARSDSSKSMIYQEMIYTLVNDDWKLQNEILLEAEPLLKKYPNIYHDCLAAVAWSGVIVGEFDKVDSIYNVLQYAYRNNPRKQKILYSEIALYKYSTLQLREADSLMQLSFIESPIYQDTTFFYQRFNGTYNTRALINLAQGKLKEAGKNLKISLKYAKLLSRDGAEAIAYGNLFYTNFDKGDINQSIKYLKKSFDFHQKRKKSKVVEIEGYLNLLNLYTDLGLEGLEEKHFFDKAQLLINEMNAVNMQVDLNIIRLKKLLNQKDTIRSWKIIEEVQEFIDNNNATLYLPCFYDMQIQYFLLTQNKKKAQLTIDKLYNLSLDQELKYHEALSLYYYSEINQENSTTLLEQSFAIADNCDNIRLKFKCLEKLVETYIAEEDFQKATQTYEVIATLKDALTINQEGLNILTNLFNEVQTYLDINTAAVKVYSKEKSNKTVLLSIVIFSVLGVLLFLIFIFYSSKQQQLETQKLKQQQEIKQDKLEQKQMKSLAESEQAKQSSILQTTKIEQLKQRLINNEIGWSQFLLEYEVLSPDFLEKCKKLDIKLTSNTLRHLLCLRMHLSSKETATLNGVGLDAVKKARYRLKKQLKLAPEASLTDYINNL